MNTTSTERGIILFFRLAMAWTFLYAASHQVFDPSFSVVGFLSHTQTFHGLFAPLTAPAVAPTITFLVAYGHLLIGLSLLFGVMTRVSSAFGILLMIVYWMAHMAWPYIGAGTTNFIIDEHIVYAGVLVYLIVKHAGLVWGVDGWLASHHALDEHPGLKPLFA